jgi:probable rRNA maturation factor
MISRPERQDSLTIDVLLDSPLWDKVPAAQDTVRQAINVAAEQTSAPAGELVVLLTDDIAMQKLNRDWRGIDKPTNVLSFPATPPVTGVQTAMLGDIAIAYETLDRECRAEDKAFLHHLSHLAVHGFLHLMGYDHQTDSDADAMERIEVAILGRLQIPDPYLARDIANG